MHQSDPSSPMSGLSVWKRRFCPQRRSQTSRQCEELLACSLCDLQRLDRCVRARLASCPATVNVARNPVEKVVRTCSEQHHHTCRVSGAQDDRGCGGNPMAAASKV